MSAEMLKTITLGPRGDEDNPMWSICKGHVDAKTFNTAHAAEGWSADDIDEDDISHEWWELLEDGGWQSSTKDNPRAEPVTVLEW